MDYQASRDVNPTGRSIELDFVRGLAIIAVMGMHFHTVSTGSQWVALIEYPLKNFGREGVNLFFTLSGFLVGGLLLRQYAHSGSVDARRFIIRRIFKIWPAYYALILFHVLAGRHPTSTFLYQNLTHMQNYLGSSIAQTWSLAVEEHFYLFLPALVLLFARLRVRANTILWTLGALCVVVLAARCAAVASGELEAASAYTQYRIDSLLIGVMLATVYWMKPELYRRIAGQKLLLLAVVAGTVVWLVFLQRNLMLEESIGYTIQAIGFAALIVLVLEYSGAIRGARLYRAVAWIGVYSYGIYLWHSVALAPGDVFIRKASAFGLPVMVAWGLALALQFAVAIIAGYAATRAIEFPFLRIRDALFPARRRSTPAAQPAEQHAA
ncbi:acyltransferase family protein [Cupriavidus basilensis]|uniref:Lysophospholipid acyltransferase n=1 Tax=Cupriavidus basilensis TaxID=68895 RepID=A0A0C4YV66_9BURK|nr:acyltransferase [Cupriavidus basilensis]AJG24461.1 Lysophospholipid acyltransferase [Cupriavidus basilensis]